MLSKEWEALDGHSERIVYDQQSSIGCPEINKIKIKDLKKGENLLSPIIIRHHYCPEKIVPVQELHQETIEHTTSSCQETHVDSQRAENMENFIEANNTSSVDKELLFSSSDTHEFHQFELNASMPDRSSFLKNTTSFEKVNRCSIGEGSLLKEASPMEVLPEEPLSEEPLSEKTLFQEEPRKKERREFSVEILQVILPKENAVDLFLSSNNDDFTWSDTSRKNINKDAKFEYSSSPTDHPLPVFHEWIHYYFNMIHQVHPNQLPALPEKFRSSNEESILRFVHHQFSKQSLSSLEHSDIMVALSNIVNTDMAGANEIFGKITNQIQEECSIPIHTVDKGLLEILRSIVENDGVDSLLLDVQARKAKVAREVKKYNMSFYSGKHWELAVILTIVEYLASMISKQKFKVKLTEIESTTHWNHVLSILIDDPVYISLGELTCISTQSDIFLIRQLFNNVNLVPLVPTKGSKIDMSVRVLIDSLGKKTLVEIGCNEHKASNISKNYADIQARKSHRINASIQLGLEEQGHNTDTTFPIYLDFHGRHGVMFAQRRFDDIIGVARIGDSLMLPTDRNEMTEFLRGPTLAMLFSYRDWITKYAHSVLCARAEGLATKGEPRKSITQSLRIKHPIIYVPTPKKNHGAKAKQNED